MPCSNHRNVKRYAFYHSHNDHCYRIFLPFIEAAVNMAKWWIWLWKGGNETTQNELLHKFLHVSQRNASNNNSNNAFFKSMSRLKWQKWNEKMEMAYIIAAAHRAQLTHSTEIMSHILCAQQCWTRWKCSDPNFVHTSISIVDLSMSWHFCTHTHTFRSRLLHSFALFLRWNK